jgi:hypothetical protein
MDTIDTNQVKSTISRMEELLNSRKFKLFTRLDAESAFTLQDGIKELRLLLEDKERLVQELETIAEEIPKASTTQDNIAKLTKSMLDISTLVGVNATVFLAIFKAIQALITSHPEKISTIISFLEALARIKP